MNYTETKEGYEELYLSYGYFLLKVLDLADTVFFVLRKKESHVSFLHVYHHAIMVSLSYLAVVFVPGMRKFYRLNRSVLYINTELTFPIRC